MFAAKQYVSVNDVASPIYLAGLDLSSHGFLNTCFLSDNNIR